MEEIRKIKGLKSQVKIMESDAELLKIEFVNKQMEYRAKMIKIQALKDEILNV